MVPEGPLVIDVSDGVVSDGGEGVMPVPVSGTFSVGMSGSLDGIERFALFKPADVGEKAASTVHVPDGAIVCPEQLSFWIINSETSVPVIERFPITRFASPVLVTVKVCIDVLPISTFPKCGFGGETNMLGWEGAPC